MEEYVNSRRQFRFKFFRITHQVLLDCCHSNKFQTSQIRATIGWIHGQLSEEQRKLPFKDVFCGKAEFIINI